MKEPNFVAERYTRLTGEPPTRLRLIVRWGARVIGTLVALVLVTAAGVYGFSERRMRGRFVVPEHALPIPSDSASVARGARLATIRGCVECHGPAFEGNVLIEDAAIGRLFGPNLTLGGRGGELEARDWERAVRHAVRRDGSPLLVMPSHEFTVLTDEDLGAIVAWARNLPKATSALPPSKAGPVPRALHLAGKFDLLPAEIIDHARPHAPRIEAGVTVEYGAYLASGCIGCHGPGLSGGKIPAAPPSWGPAANITPAGIGRWAEGDFIRALREGRRPDGSAIDTTVMKIRLVREMTDVELKALYRYLRTVPAREFGNR